MKTGGTRIKMVAGILLFSLMLTLKPIFMLEALAGKVNVPGYDRNDFIKIAEAGINNPMNNYAWSMTEFKGEVYVGTARNFLARVFQAMVEVTVLPADYVFPAITYPAGELWSQEYSEDMRGEIWRYRNGTWERVYQSVLVDVSHLPDVPEGAMEPKEPGFREMITFTDRYGQEAIYAATGTSVVSGRLLLKSTDGTNWEEVVSPPGLTEADSRSMAVHNGKLYIGPASLWASAELWATDNPLTTGDGSNWQMVGDFTDEGPGTNVAVVSMASFDGFLYAGTQNDEAGFQLWRSNDRIPQDPQFGQWTKIIDYGAGDMANTRALTMTVFKDSLIVGTSMFPLLASPPYINFPKGFELLRLVSGDTWEMLIGNMRAQKPPPGGPIPREPSSGISGGFGNIWNIYCWSLQEVDGVLYLGTFDMSSILYSLLEGNILQLLVRPKAGADLWKTEDGLNWQAITRNGFGNPGNYGIRDMVHFDNAFFLGTANPYGGLEVLEAVPTSGGGCITGGSVKTPGILQIMITGLIYVLLPFGYILMLRRRLGRLPSSRQTVFLRLHSGQVHRRPGA